MRFPKVYHPDMTVQEMIDDPQIKLGAMQIWFRYYKRDWVSDRLKPFFQLQRLQADQAKAENYVLRYEFREDLTGSWLRDIRRALLLSSTALAKKMNMKRSAFSKIELSEIDGTVSLNNLRKAAEALNCEFVYAIVPKDKITPAEKIWEILYPLACRTKFVPNVHKTQRMHGIARTARQLMEDYKFREEQGWDTRAEVSEHGVYRDINRLEARNLRAPVRPIS